MEGTNQQRAPFEAIVLYIPFFDRIVSRRLEQLPFSTQSGGSCRSGGSVKPSFLTILPAGRRGETFCGFRFVKTVLETQFAKPPSVDGFREPIGR